jgi:hypothetical protein
VREIWPPSRSKALVPCHPSTPKSASKLSVIVYQGRSQPIRLEPYPDVLLEEVADDAPGPERTTAKRPRPRAGLGMLPRWQVGFQRIRPTGRGGGALG